MSDKRMQRALATVAKRYPDMPEIQREIVASVVFCKASKVAPNAQHVIDAAGHSEMLGSKILADLVTAGVLAENGGHFTIAGPAPKLEIVVSAPVNILDPAFLNPGVPAPEVDADKSAQQIGESDCDYRTRTAGLLHLLAPVVDADKGPDSGPVALAMLATAGTPVDAGPDDESALIGWRKRLATLAVEVDAVKGEIRTIRARMRAAGKVVPDGDKRDKAPAASRSERPEPGRALSATHKGVEHVVTVGETDFAYGGESFKSLSAIGRKITGWQTCDGGLFFGLRVKSNASATPRAPKSTSTITAATAKPAPLGFGAAIAAVKVASTPPAAVPAPDAPVEAPKVDAGPGESTPDADPFLAELESLGNVATPKPAPAPNPTIKGRVPRTFSASKNA